MRRTVIARSLLYAAALPSAGFGAIYLYRAVTGSGWAAAYHERLVQGLPFAELGGPLTALYTTLVGVTGSLFLAVGVCQLVLATGIGREGRNPPAWWALLALNGVGLGGLIAVNLRNGLSSPWWLNAIVLAVVTTALALARPAPQGDAACAR
jgi:hypothetical protein